MKSKGMIPNAPNIAMISPKKGNIAPSIVAVMTDKDREINLGTMLRVENWSDLASPNFFSNNSLVGWR